MTNPINGHDSEPHINTEVLEVTGLEPEQEIRARAALAAATALGPALAVAAAAPFDPDDFGRGHDALVELTEMFVGLIRTGERPA